jgi:tetratricopeptide (TPR) repeat protein
MLCRLTGIVLGVIAWLAPVIPASAQDAAVDAQLKAAGTALQQGLIDQAVQLFSDALADKGLSSDRRAVVHNDRGVAQMRRQLWKLAIDDFNRAVVLYPEYAPAYNNRGNALVAVGTLREAIKDFDRALMLAPTYSAAFANRASASFRLGDRDAALADYSRAIELSPQSVSALNGRGLVHATAERPHAAIRDFTRAVTVDARFAAGYRNRAAAKAVTERTDDAIEDLSRAIAFDGKSVESHLLRAEAYLDAGNAASALKDFNRAIELAPRSAPAYAGRALALAKAEAFDDALNDLVKAIEIDPKLSRAYAVRAWVYKQMQQLDLAAKDTERGLKLEPITADAHWAAGEIDEARSRTEAAVQAYTKALGINARHKSTLDALNRLGLVATREETEVAGAGIERWRVLASGDHYVAVNDTLTGLRVPLEMLGKGAPKLLAWDRQKAPHAGFGVLRFTAGRIESLGLDLEAAAIIDIASPALLGLPLNKRGDKTATWSWEENKLVVASAEGLTEEFALKGVRVGTPMAAANTEKASTPRREREREPNSGGSKSGGSSPSWSPWAQPGSNSQPNRQASKPQKPASIFELLFGK